MMAELSQLPLDRIDDHPGNPRVGFREDVINGIATALNGRPYPKEHAIRVRPIAERFQIVAGHHRVRAARRVGLQTVWAWVSDMSDAEAFMELALDNNQSELTPLEIGIHCLTAVPKATGGRGRRGGLSQSAVRLGRKKATVSEYRCAAEVALNCSVNRTLLLDKAQHLCSIHGADPALWQTLVDAILKHRWSSAETAQRVSEVREFDIPQHLQQLFLPLPDVVRRSFDSEFSPGTVRSLIAAVEGTRKQIESYDIDAGVYLREFDQWLRAHASGDAWDVRKIRRKQREIVVKLEEGQSRLEESWLWGDWRDHVDRLEEGSVALALTDPPYGIAFQNRGKTTKRDVLQKDDPNAPQELREALAALYPKLRDDAHVFCFCHWSNEPEMRDVIAQAGYQLRGSLVWVKHNHSMGSNKAFTSKHERILHAVKGLPVLFERDPDVLEYARAPNERHPTEKPVDLLRRLMEVTTTEGELVADPFGGVASTAVAARQLGRRFWSCEIDTEYHEAGLKRLKEGT